MAAFNKFNSFAEGVAEGLHDFAAESFKVMLTNTAPVATNTVKANITEIAAGNGYTAGGAVVPITASSQTGGTYTAVMGANVVFTAAGGSIGPARYLVIYNDTNVNKDLVGWYDNGTSETITDGNTLTFACNGVALITLS